MMKRLAAWGLTIIIIVILAITIIYTLLQTRWGAVSLSRWVNNTTPYHITIDKIEHRWSSPGNLTLRNVSLGAKGKPTILTTQRVDIELGLSQLFSPFHTTMLTLSNGTLTVAAATPSFPVRADVLKLKNVDIHRADDSWPIEAIQISGDIRHWHPNARQLPGSSAQFQLRAQSVTLKGVTSKEVQLQGETHDGILTISSLHAQVARGALNLSAQRYQDGSWQIQQFALQGLRAQSNAPLNSLLQSLSTLPNLTLQRLIIEDATLEGKNCATTGLHIRANNLIHDEKGWHSTNGALNLHAGNLLYGSLQLNAPRLSARFSSDGVKIQESAAQWERGEVRVSGEWQRATRALALDTLSISDTEYTLPSAWRAQLSTPLPAWLNTLSIKNLTLNRNLLIDITPDFPFQLTGLSGEGQGIELVRNGRWRFDAEHLRLNALAATFNRTDLNHPMLELQTRDALITGNAQASLPDAGTLKASVEAASISPLAFTLRLHGERAPLNMLDNWGWRSAFSGQGNLELKLQGNLAHPPLRHTLNGELRAQRQDGHSETQRLVNGEMAPAPALHAQ